MKILKNNFFVCVLFPLATMLNACGGSEETASEVHEEHTSDILELTDAQYQSAGIEYGKVEKRTISGTIAASGFLDTPPQSKISISVPMGGFVKSINLLQGSLVKKGQVVAVMQNPEYIKMQQDYLESFSQLEFLKSEFERQEQLAAENVNARKSLEQAKANYNTMRATVQGLKATLEMLNISVSNLEKGEIQNNVNLYSPIAGYVTKVNTNIGAFVNPTDVLLEIVNTENLHAELTIYEKDIASIQIGQRVLFTLSGEDQTREAIVQLIGREISQERSVQVHCEIVDEDKELIPGMYLQAFIETDSAHVTAVPEDAVVYFEGKSYIFIAATEQEKEEEYHHEEGESHEDESHAHESGEHTFKMIEVNLGEAEMNYVQLFLPENFDADSRIVVKGAYSLLAKMKNSEEEGHGH